MKKAEPPTSRWRKTAPLTIAKEQVTLLDRIAEQSGRAAIAAPVLYWHQAQTARLIRAKKKIIALLNEQKQGIRHKIGAPRQLSALARAARCRCQSFSVSSCVRFTG